MTESDGRRLLVVPIALAMVAALAWAGGRGGAVAGPLPLFGLCAGVAVAMQWIAFVPAYAARTERWYDLTGSLTYLTVTALAVTLGPPLDARSVVLALLVAIWAARLGAFLFRRIRAEGADRRFDGIRTSASRFFVAWTLQGVWVCFTAGAALAALTAGRSAPLGALTWAGLALWMAGFGIEVVADRQKAKFRANPTNEGRFIDTGLWAWSRHPNYFGEIVLWVGVALVSLPALRGWQYATLTSPAFVAMLLTKVSGIPMLEQRADERWSGDAGYEAYKAATPILVPRPRSATRRPASVPARGGRT